MKRCRIVVLWFCLINIVSASLLHSHEQLMRVRKASDASDKRFFLDFVGLAQLRGYEAEQHYVKTTDGYTLEIFRIPSSPLSLSNKVDGKSVVLIQHGIVSSSDTWAFLDRSIVYALADAGYDVWAGNYRGNTYGRSHQTLSPEEPLFWNYTWHEVGTIDYASTIDYILNVTHKPNLTFIGHSMAGTAVFALLSDRPEYNNKINGLIAMAPVLFWRKYDPIRSLLGDIICILKDSLDPVGFSELLPQSTLPNDVVNNFCKKNNILGLCFVLLGLFLRGDADSINTNDLQIFLKYYPAGVSSKTIEHYCQLVKADKFIHYNYGTKNLEYYGEIVPPEYNLKNVKTKTTIIFSENDWLSTREDVEAIAEQVSANITLDEINIPGFTHLDFIMAKNMKYSLYNRIFKTISNYGS